MGWGNTSSCWAQLTFWWCNGCYNMALALVKLSLLFQYLRLLDENPDKKQPRTRIAIICLIAVTSIWGIVYSILAWVPCIPVEAHWNFEESATRYGYGSDEVPIFVATYIIHAACNMAIDIAVLAIPIFSKSMWVTTDNQMRSRIAMIGLYILGGLSVICSVVRFILIVHTRATTSPTFDPSWYGASTCILSILEVDLATIVASLPVFWPHLRRNIDKIMITREVEVKVTHEPRPFTQIEDQATKDGTRSGASDKYVGDPATILPWEIQGTNTSSTKGSESIVLQDLRRSYSNKRTNDVKLFNPHNSSHSRSISNPITKWQLGRDSKEVLLR
ncbi:hypothetical protein J7T55_011552 [Diaporthe amygdali]|uniref:uncharacterized protein n=1 Tax=Phomopsis amygdali TaxID=1214568 RepID=UPI0022FE96CD|nr:uncharacterized protein J7T55_011552 [Diaporthe amygdali]KAJ0123088.1 hypothetical protein J7T55_011552 [Diaporthe amygdali]